MSAFFYHHSRIENRDSIQQHGLQINSPFDPEVHYDEGDAPRGVYMHSSWQSAKPMLHSGMDVWRVRAKGLRVNADPDDRSDVGSESVYSDRDISAQRISRVFNDRR